MNRRKGNGEKQIKKRKTSRKNPRLRELNHGINRLGKVQKKRDLGRGGHGTDWAMGEKAKRGENWGQIKTEVIPEKWYWKKHREKKKNEGIVHCGEKTGKKRIKFGPIQCK